MLLLFEIYAREICEKFVYKHSETKEYVKISLVLKKLQTSRANNPRILKIKILKFSGYSFL